MSLQSIKFSIPGKTFLGGEYAALFGGPSLVLATHPNFEFVGEPGTGKHSFHPESPAGKYIGKHNTFFKTFDLNFKTPVHQSGGFGGSTAEFIGVYLLKTFATTFEGDKWVDLRELNSPTHPQALCAWSEYHQLFSEKSIKPSGADLIAQLLGGLTVFSREFIETLNWPFSDKEIFLFKTSHKVPTHDHLAQLKISTESVTGAQEKTEAIIQALKSAHWEWFIEAQKQLSAEFERQNWLSEHTAHLVEKLLLKPGVFWARGCGSLGADVIAVFANKTQFDRTSIKDLTYVASLSENLSSGVVMEITKK